MSFSFLCGMLACCISGCVSVNRFGFAIEGAWCAFDRLYYDSLHGQLKANEPKWKGFNNAFTIFNNLDKFIVQVKNNKNNLPTTDEFTDYKTCGTGLNVLQQNEEKAYEYINKYKKITSSLIY